MNQTTYFHLEGQMVSLDGIKTGSGASFDNIWLGDTNPVTVFLMPMKMAEFDRSLFQKNGIFLPEEISRSVTKRQAEYYYGRLCAREALGAIGVTDHVLATGRSREPLWPTHVIGSISHNDVFSAAVALRKAPSSGIGIDIESLFDLPQREAVLDLAITAQEYSRLSLNQDIELDLSLLIAFSAKESFFKATFNTVGAYFDFDAVAVKEISPQRKVITFEVAYDLCSQFKRGRTVQIWFDLIDPRTVITGFWW